MGLDNGIVVKVKEPYIGTIYHQNFFELYSDFMEDDFPPAERLDICYWHKYWSLRNNIIRYLSTNKITDEVFEITLNDIWVIRNFCTSYITTAEQASTVWSRVTEVMRLAKSITQLESLTFAIKTFNEIHEEKDFFECFEIHFYEWC